jgi:hypothetical protein
MYPGRNRHFHTKVGNSRTTSGASIQNSFSATMVRPRSGARVARCPHRATV